MISDILRQVAEIVSFWESGTGYTLTTAYPEIDRHDDSWYAEWIEIRKRRAEMFNGFSSGQDPVAELRDLVQRVAEQNGVIIDHIVKHDGQVLVFWHRPGVQIRLYGTAPAVVAVPPVMKQMKGVVA